MKMKNQKNRRENYFPSQPEIEINTSFYEELKPDGLWLSQDIALFYQFKTDPISPTIISLIPDGCFDLLFCCHPTLPSAFLWTSPFHRKEQPEFLRDCEYFGVRFFPEQSIIKLNYPMNELLDNQIPLFEVLTCDQSIIELLASGKSFKEKITQFEQYLKRIRFDMGKNQKIVRYAINEIYSTRGMLNVSELSDSIGYSEQHIRRKFEEYIGFSPKQFCQVVKFQNTLDIFLKRDGSDILDIIYENGYYDQAHFIKGFKKFTHLTPKQYKKYFSEKT
jgi:AraC-like DNA-binding protein